MTEMSPGPGAPEQPVLSDKELAIRSAAGQLAGEALGGGEPHFGEEHKNLTAEDWDEARKQAHEMIVGPKAPSSRAEREAARESMTDEEKAKDDLINRAAGQLAGEALGGGSANIGEEYKDLTDDDWDEARRRASEIVRGA